jgi:hypothetical protein
MFRKYSSVTPWILVALLVGVLIGTYAAPAGALPGLSSRTDPAYSYGSYTESDTVNFAGGPSRQIQVTTGGALALVDLDDNVVTHTVADGAILNLVAKRINATGTDAAGFLVLH